MERRLLAGFSLVVVVAAVAAGPLGIAGLSLFPSSGEFLLPVSRALSEQIHYARLLGSSPPV
ncbi:hypothetical protein EGH21_07205 [Halomicroarcula sp. F13]|uniref:Uncharacterized protein n=1 Tax=Haloarcula rubra TaxID=2487747 RepID=A0AAW4PQ25_9EURY|nr:hypothetical protein [Halomicroarcula rubra]MBX0322816.1 hypothetical protein [Halomicroarcula rubra]